MFVTVGTTSFDRLIETVSTKDFVEVSHVSVIVLFILKKLTIIKSFTAFRKAWLPQRGSPNRKRCL